MSDQSQPPQWLRDLFGGTKVVGRAMSYWSAFVGTLLGIAVVVLGVALIRKHNPYTGSTKASILKVSACTHDKGIYNCTLQVAYAVGSKSYSEGLAYSGSSIPVVGGHLKIEYNPSNPVEIRQGGLISGHTLGWILLGFGVLVVIGVWVNAFMVTKYSGLAAAEGVGGLLDIATGQTNIP